MISTLLLLVNRYNGLVLRQRIVLLMAFLSLVYFVWYFLFLLPIYKESKNLKIENNYLSGLQEEAGQLEDESKGLVSALGIVSLNNKLNTLKTEVNSLDVELKKYFSIVNFDNDFMGIVKDLVNTTKGIRLEAIELLPVESIAVGSYGNKPVEEQRYSQSYSGNNKGVNSSGNKSKDEDDEDNFYEQDGGIAAVVYKHRVYIKLEGSYAGLTRYLNQIESLGWGLFMQDIHYKLDSYPNAKVDLLVYSLSLGDANVF